MKVYKTVIDWLLGQQQFCLTLRLRTTDPFKGKTKLLLFSNQVNNCIVLPVSSIFVIIKAFR